MKNGYPFNGSLHDFCYSQDTKNVHNEQSVPTISDVQVSYLLVVQTQKYGNLY